MEFSQLFGVAIPRINRLTVCNKSAGGKLTKCSVRRRSSPDTLYTIAAIFCCSCSLIVSAPTDDAHDNNDNDDSSSDDDNDDTETDVIPIDAGEQDTASDTDICPWSCKAVVQSNASSCDLQWDGNEQTSPIEVRNPHLDRFCLANEICCQPIDSSHPLSLIKECKYDGMNCIWASNCLQLSTTAYCHNTKLLCCL